MRAHFQPAVVYCRMYPEGYKPVDECYRDHDDWEGAFVIQITGDKAWISLCQGKFDRQVFRQAKEYVKSLGVDLAEWDGNGSVQRLHL